MYIIDIYFIFNKLDRAFRVLNILNVTIFFLKCIFQFNITFNIIITTFYHLVIFIEI